MDKTDISKDKNMTVRVTAQLRQEIDSLREIHFPEVQINSFLAYLVRIGLEEEKLRIEEEKLRKESRLKNAAKLEISQSTNSTSMAQIMERLNLFNLGDKVAYKTESTVCYTVVAINKEKGTITITNSKTTKEESPFAIYTQQEYNNIKERLSALLEKNGLI